MALLDRFNVRWSFAGIVALALLLTAFAIAGCGSVSPSGAAGYEVAFQAKDGNLWTVGASQHGDWGFRVARGTSPSLTP